MNIIHPHIYHPSCVYFYTLEDLKPHLSGKQYTIKGYKTPQYQEIFEESRPYCLKNEKDINTF